MNAIIDKPRIRVPATSQPVKAVEGEERPGPWYVHWPDGMLPNSWGKQWNFWQSGYDPISGDGAGAILHACISSYVNAVSQCPLIHWRATADGGRERLDNSAIARLLRAPNHYQTRSDFIGLAVSDLLTFGNSFSLAERNGRYEPEALHSFNPSRSKAVVGEQQAIFFELSGNTVLEGQQSGFWGDYIGGQRGLYPQRDVLHMRIDTKPGDPLLGRAPWRHAADAVTVQTLIGKQLISMFANGGRPSGVIHTDLNLTAAQITELRARLNESWKSVDDLSGGPPILTNGLKFQNVGQSAKDTELSNAAKLSADEIFAAYQVPPAILGLTDRSTYASTEALVQHWLAGGLGHLLDLIECSLDQFLQLPGWPLEYVEFDVSILLRAQQKDRVEALTRGIQGGLFAPNEARRTEELGSVAHGDQVLVQQQMVPLGWQPQQAAPAAPTASEPEEVSFNSGIVRRVFSQARVS